MKCSIIERSTISFDHLATPLQHTVDQSLYATLIQVGPGPLQNALEFLQRGIILHLLVGFPLDVISQRFLKGLQSGDLAGHSIRSMPFSSKKLIGDSSTMRSCIVVHKDKLVFDQFLEENGIERMEWPARCREVIEADGGPINY